MKIRWAALLLGLPSLVPAASISEISPDAGLTLSTAQVETGPPGTILNSISGHLGASDADMFGIRLTAGTVFTASTISSLTNFFDMALFLFDPGGLGVIANDDDANSPPQSFISFTPTVTGTYYLAIAGFGFHPANPDGLLFPAPGGFLPAGLVSPSGPGGAQALQSWSGVSSEAGAYVIELTGAELVSSVPEPATLALTGAALLAAGLFRRFQQNKK